MHLRRPSLPLTVSSHACPVAQKDTCLPATEAKISSLRGGEWTAEMQATEEAVCPLCQTADTDGTIAVGTQFLAMPCEKHAFHAGCLMRCLREHDSCPACYVDNLRRAHRARSRACHPDKVAQRYHAEIDAAADPDAKRKELEDAATEMSSEINGAYRILKDWRKRYVYDRTGIPPQDDEDRPPPSVTHTISAEQHRTGGEIQIAKNRVFTTITLCPNELLPRTLTLGPETGQPGAKITIELQPSDAPVSRSYVRIDLGNNCEQLA
eukprot:COSAG06_NODE_16875_length_976_cov_0.641961_1_plen_265_part_10